MQAKPTLLAALLLAFAATSQAADPMAPIWQAVSTSYGASTLDRALLLKSGFSATEPAEWALFARDPHRAHDLVKLQVTPAGQPGLWKAESVASGKLLQRSPTVTLDTKRVRISPTAARAQATRAAALAKLNFASAEYQLAAETETGAPQWALTLADAQGVEVGFVVMSAETGAVVYQDFGAPSSLPPRIDKDDRPVASGEEAARAVKKSARRAWDWTEQAGRETGGFFRELFKRR